MDFEYVKIDKVECIGEFEDEYVYDIEVDSECHNFFANDLLVHNSVYFTVGATIKDLFGKIPDKWTKEDVKKVCVELDSICDKVNENCKRIVENDFLSNVKCIKFGRETFCNCGAFTAKKHYLLHLLDDEGAFVDKWKIAGIELKKKEIPDSIKVFLREIIYDSVLTLWTPSKYREKLFEVWEKFESMKPDEIAFIKGYTTTKPPIGFLRSTKGAQSHARAANYFNQLIEHLKLNQKYNPIQVGDRIRYALIKRNNPYGIDVIGWTDVFPKEFENMFEVDYKKMFEKIVLAPLKRFEEINGWGKVNPGDQYQKDIMEL